MTLLENSERSFEDDCLIYNIYKHRSEIEEKLGNPDRAEFYKSKREFFGNENEIMLGGHNFI